MLDLHLSKCKLFYIMLLLIILVVLFYICLNLDMCLKFTAGDHPEVARSDAINAIIRRTEGYPFKDNSVFKFDGDRRVLFPTVLRRQAGHISGGGIKPYDISKKFFKVMTGIDTNAILALRIYTTGFFNTLNNTTRIIHIPDVNIMFRYTYETLSEQIDILLEFEKLLKACPELAASKVPEFIDKLRHIGRYNYLVKPLATHREYTDALALLTTRPRIMDIDLQKLYDKDVIEEYCKNNNAIRVIIDMVRAYKLYYEWTNAHFNSPENFPSLILGRGDDGDIGLWCKPDVPIKNFSSFTYNLPNMFVGTKSILATPVNLKLLAISPISVYPDENEILLPFVKIGNWEVTPAHETYVIETTINGKVYDPHEALDLRKIGDHNNLAIITEFEHPDYTGTDVKIGYGGREAVRHGGDSNDVQYRTKIILMLELMYRKYGSTTSSAAINELKKLNVDKSFLAQHENDVAKMNYLKRKYSVRTPYRSRQ